ncbi:hypothetical protein Rt10032_c02g1136 [Rhodotorula toruloides]|uniref:Uncharacterized protein n=1 Tax=Rhodotorula toruloides TaxID=5286 RepID=A0A511K9W4_RHOTO|nr:hypothetical protein Rt10032_c02g1136 [Rhodotorula toruloides]
MAGGVVASNVKVAGPALTRRQEIFSFALVTSLFFAWGLSYGLIDVLNKKVVEHFSISKLQSTLLQVAYFGAYLVYSVPASLFASRFDYRAGILMGLTLYCLGALAFWRGRAALSFSSILCAFISSIRLAVLVSGLRLRGLPGVTPLRTSTEASSYQTISELMLEYIWKQQDEPTDVEDEVEAEDATKKDDVDLEAAEEAQAEAFKRRPVGLLSPLHVGLALGINIFVSLNTLRILITEYLTDGYWPRLLIALAIPF